MANLSSTIPFSGQAISPNTPQEIQLKSGQIFLFPVGNFLVKPGAQTAIQWNDDNSGLWRTFQSGPCNAPIMVESDGSNFRAINLSGIISGVNITVAGTAYTQANTSVSFAAPASGVTATGTPIIGGSLTFAVSGGTGYTNPYLLIPAPQLLGGTPGLCIPATASLAISAGALSSITTGFAGAGYVTAPGASVQTITPEQYAANPSYYNNSTNIIIVDENGTGGTVTATLANGTATSGGLTGVVMTNPGSGYDGTHIPAVTVTSATGSSAAATALPNLALTSITVGGTNTGYSASVILESSLGNGTALASVMGDPVMGREARAVATQSGGVLATPVIEDAGMGFQTVPLVKQVGNATADGSVNATFVAVVGGVTNTLILWQVG